MENEILFSVNHYDQDGDVVEHGIYLHFGDIRLKVAKDPTDFFKFIRKLDMIRQEIADNYMDCFAKGVLLEDDI